MLPKIDPQFHTSEMYSEMSDHTIRELYRSLERTIHERLCILDEARGDASFNPRDMFSNLEATIRDRLKVIEKVLNVGQAPVDGVIAAMQEKLNRLHVTVEGLRTQVNASVSLIPPHPLQGIEVIPKREVVLPAQALVVAPVVAPVSLVPEPLSVADRLLLNTDARKALEEEEGDIEEEEEEEEELQLEEFEYKGATYYRDPDSNVYMTDEDGELVQEAIGTWNAAKQRILVKKPE